METGPQIIRGDQTVINYEPTPGGSVKTAIEEMIALAKESGVVVRARLNGIELRVTKDSTAEDTISDLKMRTAEAGDAYRKSTEKERLTREKEEQEKVDALIEQLPNLDFKDPEAVLDWIYEFQYPNNAEKRRKVLEAFAEHGYQPNINTGKAFNGNDDDNFAHYVVGQMLVGLRGDVGPTFEVITKKLVEDWKKKFAR